MGILLRLVFVMFLYLNSNIGSIKFINQLNVDLSVFKNLIGFIGAWTLTWTPHAVVTLMGISGYGPVLTVS